MAGWHRGAADILELLEERLCDLREQDPAGFRRWLERRLQLWARDPIFRQRLVLRDLRRRYPELLSAEERLWWARQAEASSTEAVRMARLERELHRTGQAIRGLSLAPPGPGRDAKLAGFERRRPELARELQVLREASPWRRLESELEALRERLGVGAEEARLAEMLRAVGHRSGQSGRAFEMAAREFGLVVLAPEVGADTLLTGVTLGAAHTEFDQLLVATEGPRVRVLAAVEVKRNPNDLARGYRHRSENLAWLRQQRDCYDPARYRTGYYRSGHFDREAIHIQDGRSWRLDAESFAGEVPLYCVTRPGTLWGAGARALARMAFRVATDPRLDLDSPESLAGLGSWCLSLTEPFETPDLLRLHVRTGRMVFCRWDSRPSKRT